jgi:hypothetical protein
MVEPGREPDLFQKALRAERLAELRLEHLERDDRSCRWSRARYTTAIPPWPISRSMV